jgi:hypothetical protein
MAVGSSRPLPVRDPGRWRRSARCRAGQVGAPLAGEVLGQVDLAQDGVDHELVPLALVGQGGSPVA